MTSMEKIFYVHTSNMVSQALVVFSLKDISDSHTLTIIQFKVAKLGVQ